MTAHPWQPVTINTPPAEPGGTVSWTCPCGGACEARIDGAAVLCPGCGDQYRVVTELQRRAGVRGQ